MSTLPERLTLVEARIAAGEERLFSAHYELDKLTRENGDTAKAKDAVAAAEESLGILYSLRTAILNTMRTGSIST